MNKELDLEEENRIGTAIVKCAIKLHRDLGPGLLEKVYEICLAYLLEKEGFKVKRQTIIPVKYEGLTFDEGFKLDLIVNDKVICEIKSIENVNRVWDAQIISHLRLTEKKLGYLLNFCVPMMKQGIRRFANTKRSYQILPQGRNDAE